MKRHFLLAFRNLLKYKTFSLINIFGLGIGMAGAFMMLQFVVHEITYDHFHKHAERIFRIESYDPANSPELSTLRSFSEKLAPYLQENDPGIERFVRISKEHDTVIKNPDQPTLTNSEDNFAFVDTSFFSVFDFKILHGNPSKMLSNPSTVVISNRTAEKYFGSQNPVGQKLEFKSRLQFYSEALMEQAGRSFQDKPHLLEVTGVMDNPPANSTFQFDLISSVQTQKVLDTLVKTPFYETYLLLRSKPSKKMVERKLKAASAFIKSHNYNEQNAYRLTPFLSIHQGESKTRALQIRILSVIVATILLLALFNYINLTTARATVRSKEVGIRKTLGVSKFSLLVQFFTESLVIVLFAFVLALILAVTFQPAFNTIFGIQTDLKTFLSPTYIGVLLIVFTGVALASGIYPAMILSGFPPIRILRWNASLHYQGVNLRRVFITLQFVASTVLIMASLLVQKQIHFLQNKNPGFNKKQLLTIDLGPKMGVRSHIIRDALKNQYGFENVCTSAFQMFKSYPGPFTHYNPRTKTSDFLVSFIVDAYFLQVIEMQMEVPFDANVPADSNGFYTIVNERLVEDLGLTKQHAIGEELFQDSKTPAGKIAGIAKSFDIFGPKFGAHNFRIQVHNGKTTQVEMNNLFVRLKSTDNIPEKIALLEKVYRKYEVDRPFKYAFVDDIFNQTFKEDLRISKTTTVFTGIAILLACMGLFGLITFTTETRTKEIGIRKTLGAGVPEIVRLLSVDFIKLVTLALIIALPLAHFGMQTWLQNNFAHQTEISWWIYVLTSVVALSLAAVTVGTQSARAASVNPVDSLKIE